MKIGSHACSLEASMRVTNGISLGCPLFLPVHTVNCVQTLKVDRLDRRVLERRLRFAVAAHAADDHDGGGTEVDESYGRVGAAAGAGPSSAEYAAALDTFYKWSH
jgi:hypothetical protein